MSERSRRFATLGIAVSTLMLASCSSLMSSSEGDAAKAAEMPKRIAVVREPLSADRETLRADLMYQVLAAELLVQKGEAAEAFEILYPLAVKTRDPELAKRAFELSMNTYDEQKILQATNLWLETEPESPTPWRAAYLMSLRNAQLDQAIEQWEKYRAQSSRSAEEDILSAVQRVARAAQAETALPFFDYLTKQHDSLWQAWYSYGLLAEHYRQLEKSAALLETALQRLPQSERDQQAGRIYQSLSKVYIQLDAPERGLQKLGNYLKESPDDWLVQERVARLEVKAGRFESAQKRYQRILKANPDATTSRLSLALLQIEMSEPAQARVNLEQVSQQSGFESVGHYYLGVLSQEQGELEAALDLFDLVRADPYRVDAQLHKAEILFTLHGLPRALQVLDDLQLESREGRVKVLRAKAIFYRAAEQPEKSIELYDQALALQMDNIDLLLAQSVLFYDTGRYDRYVANLERVIELRPNEVDALNALGYFYVERNIELQKAESLLKRALKLAPDSYYILDSMGWLAYRKQAYRLAVNYLQRALEIQFDKEVLMHLIAAQWQAGQKAQATSLWEKYRSQFANDSNYQALIEKLEKGSPL